MRSDPELGDFRDLLNIQRATPTRRLAILGVSGSVGGTALRYIRKHPGMELFAASVHSSVETLRSVLHDHPATLRHAAITSESSFDRSIDALRMDFPGITFYRGDRGVVEMVSTIAGEGCDTILTAVVGACGIQATMEAIRLGMKIALANKETLVTAGPAIVATLRRMENTQREKRPVILPVDSEHNAIFQVLSGIPSAHVDRIILTASGGPFLDRPAEDLAKVRREEVLDHPTWNMGPKITVDSAGLVNKGLEVMEAHYLFSAPYDSLDVLIHRKSFVHGMVRTTDGGYLLCASRPSMVFPVAHSLHYPDPVPGAHDEALSPEEWPPLVFEKVPGERFPGFRLALEAGRKGGTATAIYNAANEIAVDSFLKGNIGFTDIPNLIEMVLEKQSIETGEELDLYLEADRRARSFAESLKSRFEI